jgi:hypothetical protein
MGGSVCDLARRDSQSAQQEISAIAARLELNIRHQPRRGIASGRRETPSHAGELMPISETLVVVCLFCLSSAPTLQFASRRSFAPARDDGRSFWGWKPRPLLRQLVTRLAAVSLRRSGRHASVLVPPRACSAFRGGDDVPSDRSTARVLGLSAAICLVVTLAVGLVPIFRRAILPLDTLKTEASAVMVPAAGRGFARALWSPVTLSFRWWARPC